MVAPLSWDQFQKNQPEAAPAEKNTQSVDESKGISWGDFQNTSTYQGEPDPTADESSWGYLLRNTVSHVARGAERFLGKYGDIEKTSKQLLSKDKSQTFLQDVIKSIVGEKSYENLKGQGLVEQGNIPRLLSKGKQMIPTSEDLQKGTEALTGEYTKPRTKKEQKSQNVIGDIASIGASRYRQGAQAGQYLLNKVGIPVATNAAKETVEGLGFGEENANYAKSATQLALTLLNVNAPQHAADLMNQGRRGFGPGISADVPRLEASLNRVARPLLQGDPRSATAQKVISDIREDISNGRITMPDLMNRYDALNAVKRDKGLFELSRGDRKAAIRNINTVRDALRREINTLGQRNPQAIQAWNDGVNAFAAIHQSKALTNTISGFLRGPYGKTIGGPIASMFGLGGGYGLLQAPLVGIGGAPAVAGLYKAGQVASRVWKDPTLAKYYWNAMRDAATDNRDSFISNYLKLQKIYDKKYPEENKNQ